MSAPGSRPIAVDLFSGVGGLTLGLEQAGFDVLVAVENNRIDANAHRFNFPHCEVIQKDVRSVSAHEIKSALRKALSLDDPAHALPRIDLVCGGPPCQGFSSGGKRQIGDDRNALLFEFSRLVGELSPRYCLLENVPGLLHKRYDGIVAKLKAELVGSGYCLLGPLRINAERHGVPQDRERVFLIGYRSGEKKPRRPRIRKKKVSVKDALDGLPSADQPSVAETPKNTKLTAYGLRLNWHVEAFAYPRVWKRGTVRDLVATQHSSEVRDRFADIVPGKADPISRFFRLSLSGVSSTLRAGTGRDRGSHTAPRPIHPTEPRVINVREAARLHSFPDWFGFASAKWHAWRQIGNSVPPALARAIGSSIQKALGGKPVRPRRHLALGCESMLDARSSGDYTSDSRKTG